MSISRRKFLRYLLNLPLIAYLPFTRAREAEAQARREFRLAFGSCAWQDEDQPIWDTIAAARPDVFAFIGDNIYADSEDMSEVAAKYEKLGRIPAFRRFRARVPIVFTWDDHDYGANDAGREYPRKHETKNLMFRFFGEDLRGERARRDGVYTSYIFGTGSERTQLILLDLRWFRSPLVSDDQGAYVANPDPRATILGEEQWRWLEAELQRPADFRILASSTQFVSGEHPWEKWSNFPYEKARLLALLDRYEIRNLAIISGDMHYGELSMETTPAGIAIYDLTSSGLNYFEPGANLPNARRLAIFDNGCNYGNVNVDYSAADSILVSLEVRGLDGHARIRRVLRYPRPPLMF